MTIGGQEYTRDLIILPGGSLHHPWWRASGHHLVLKDLGPLLGETFQALVIGTGAAGRMHVDPGLVARIEARGVAIHALPTGIAVSEYNARLVGGEAVAGCFHLTC